MTAGLPGTGVGGLYYITMALLLPVRTALRAGRGRTGWGAALGSAGLAIGMFIGMWVAGWLLGHVVAPLIASSLSRGHGMPQAPQGNFFRWFVVLAGYLSLSLILAMVQVARLVVKRAPVEHRRPTPRQLPRLTPSSLERLSGGHARPALDGG